MAAGGAAGGGGEAETVDRSVAGELLVNYFGQRTDDGRRQVAPDHTALPIPTAPPTPLPGASAGMGRVGGLRQAASVLAGLLGLDEAQQLAIGALSEWELLAVRNPARLAHPPPEPCSRRASALSRRCCWAAAQPRLQKALSGGDASPTERPPPSSARPEAG
eukprot:SAG11_NODE_14642_length_604_cov_7.633663_1_plen_161_part_01